MSSIASTRSNASTASEWLSAAAPQLLNAPDAHRADQLTTLAFLAASLERQGALVAPPAHAVATLRDALAQVPTQLAHLPATDPAYTWLHLSALAEFWGEPTLARLFINSLAALLGEHAVPARTPEPATTDTEAHRRERLALCWTRRGRMARVAGALDDATACFEEALTLVADTPWRDARVAAELGAINLAAAYGNYPAVEQRCTAVLQHGHDALAPMHVAAAFQLRAIARRKRRQFLEALLDSWSAYDQLGHASAYRAELVVSMAETALEAGDLQAAAAGFTNAQREAIATNAQYRVQAGAVIGRARAVNACLQAGLAVFSHDDASQVRRDLDVMLAAPLAPRERVYALITVAEWHGREQQAGAARAALLEASTLATAHAFFDYQFRTAELLEQMDTPRTEPAVPSASEHWASSERHPALARLAALA